MFTDWTEALEAESLPLDPTSARQLAAAARATARSSCDKHDLTLLLDMLGLPADPDTLTALLPLIPETGDAPTMTNTPAAPALSAFEAMAISMHNNGDSEQAIREATGLSDTELNDLIATQVPGVPADTPGTPDAATPDAATPVIDVPVVALPVTGALQELIDWASAHTAAGVRSRAARVTADLSELSERRNSEAAQREAEAKVAKAKAELEKAQEELRTVKVGTRTTTAAATAPTPIRAGLGSGRTREELAAVRTWARENGHRVADAGMVPKRVLQAYDAAHRAPVRKAG
ncbi:histone-like nucleoid-structuring protein Lsr2 [Streptomyces bacillaris]|uniref:Lsr2 family DNA-binding protein n=1 Tax=Streptomyces bacillaris TaxID=68179 RepID=UPI00345F4ADF